MAEAGAIRANAAELLERAQQLRVEGSSKTQDAVDAASRAEKAEVAHARFLVMGFSRDGNFPRHGVSVVSERDGVQHTLFF